MYGNVWHFKMYGNVRTMYGKKLTVREAYKMYGNVRTMYGKNNLYGNVRTMYGKTQVENSVFGR